jgi:hypothetical protein
MDALGELVSLRRDYARDPAAQQALARNENLLDHWARTGRIETGTNALVRAYRALIRDGLSRPR